MLECLEFRDEKNALGAEGFDNGFAQNGAADPHLVYGKFLFSQLEKGQGLTVANTLRRILLYEIPAVGITSVLIRTPEGISADQPNKTVEGDSAKTKNSSFSESMSLADAKARKTPNSSNFEEEESLTQSKKNLKNEIEIENSETSLLSELASSHHEFSTLPGVKESVLELLQNLKSVVFENVFPYSSIQKGTLLLKGNILPAEKQSFQDFYVRAHQLVLPSELRVIYPDQILATLTKPLTNFELEFTLEKITQSDLTRTSAFSGRASNRSTRNRRILPIDGTVFPVKKVNYTIEQDSFGKELVFFEVWTNGGLHPRAAVYQAIEKVLQLFQAFQAFQE